MHGGWCWRPVEALLREAGHVAHTPTLTGMGDRAHLLSPQVGVDTHARDVVAILRMEDVRDGVLVVHSDAGVLAGPVVEQARGRVGRVVAMGAFLVDPGEPLADVGPREVMDRYRRIVAEQGQGRRVPASPAVMDQWSVPNGLWAIVAPAPRTSPPVAGMTRWPTTVRCSTRCPATMWSTSRRRSRAWRARWIALASMAGERTRSPPVTT